MCVRLGCGRDKGGERRSSTWQNVCRRDEGKHVDASERAQEGLGAFSGQPRGKEQEEDVQLHTGGGKSARQQQP